MKTNLTLGVLCVLLWTAVACKPSPNQESTEATQETEMSSSLSFSMEPKSDSNVQGTATFTAKDSVVAFHIELTGLTPGVHAIHLHETAD